MSDRIDIRLLDLAIRYDSILLKYRWYRYNIDISPNSARPYFKAITESGIILIDTPAFSLFFSMGLAVFYFFWYTQWLA